MYIYIGKTFCKSPSCTWKMNTKSIEKKEEKIADYVCAIVSRKKEGESYRVMQRGGRNPERFFLHI